MADESRPLLERIEEAEAAQAAAEPAFPSVVEFVTQYLADVLERRVKGRGSNTSVPARWCPYWYDHPEALARFVALWYAWEVLRLELGVGMSVWWKDHFDVAWLVLTSEHGPFSACHDKGEHIPEPQSEILDFALPPAEWIPPAH